MFKKFITNPYVSLFVGIFLIASCVVDGWGVFHKELMAMDLDVYHGGMLLGVWHVLRSCVEIVDLFGRFE